ncbi:MAG: malto-oligosyltrehalose synthase [Planctomycetes bacterium]|nr:malto-oligosyltrehalose synthase [Planctomycetota bacterium]
MNASAMSQPVATYRLQLQAGFGFDDAAAVAGYLAALGVSHVYLSPVLAARPGSTHGYDVIDPTRVSPELGGEAGFRRMVGVFREHGLGVVLDIVPNHMAVWPANHLWLDVLARGRDSRWAGFFDIDWDPPWEELRGKVLLPILGDHYGAMLADGRIAPVLKDGRLVLRCGELELPLSGAEATAETVEALARDPQRLHRLLGEQHYLLAYWPAAASMINYRRFFDITHLVGLCVERPEVFQHIHQLPLAWIAEGLVQGLRVDHPDGLRDPKAYFDHLRSAAPEAWIVAEKILTGQERLPAWAVDGTTGYDFANAVGGLFIDPCAERPLTDFYAEFTGATDGFADVARRGKREMLDALFGGDLDRLVERLVRIAQRRPAWRDLTRRQLRGALRELAACLPTYRTYVDDGPAGPLAADAARIGRAVAEARGDGDDPLVWDYLAAVLSKRVDDPEAMEVVARFQQLTGAAAAKGVEDTALYRYLRLASLNEVGGDPGRFGVPVEAFHRFCLDRQCRWPSSLLGTSTHDTKRSEDVRLRISALTEMPDAWIDAVRRWGGVGRGVRPGRNDEYLLYQTLIGAWPLERERLDAYAVKAAREAKVHTSWTSPSEAYEDALKGFIAALLADAAFLDDLKRLVDRLAPAARIHSLAQTLLKCTCPGVPDFYQGSELWTNSLVDPDNRRPVDFDARRRLLAEAPPAMDTAAPKLRVIHTALRVRRGCPEAFGPQGRYEPLQTEGAAADHLVAFARGDRVVTVVPRLVLHLDGCWGGTAFRLPAGRYRDAFTDRVFQGGWVRVRDVFGTLCAGLLVKEG